MIIVAKVFVAEFSPAGALSWLKRKRSACYTSSTYSAVISGDQFVSTYSQ